MRRCLKWLCCVSIMFCLGQVREVPSELPVFEDEWRERDGPGDDPCDPMEPPVEAGLILDDMAPKRDNYLGCLFVSAGEAYQQRITILGEGFLGRIDVTTGAMQVTYPRIGLTLSKPWVENYSDKGDGSITFSKIIESQGDIFEWDTIDISHLGWYVRPGDQLTLHFWPQEETCMGYNGFFCENYEGGEMWQDRLPWGCQNPENAPADISFRLWRIESNPLSKGPLPSVLDQQCPPDGKYVNACLRMKMLGIWTDREYQQRITVGMDGTLSRIEVTTCEEVTLLVGLSRGAPWIGTGEGNPDTEIWEIKTVESTGRCYNGYTWVPIDLSSLDWNVKKGDQLSLHFWPQEVMCLGFQYYFGKDYEGGEMWISCKNPDDGGHKWGCKAGHPDIDFRLFVTPPEPK